jgi:hypothetical protein
MKSLIAIACVLTATSIASAQPGMTSVAAESAPTTTTTYVSVGTVVGVDGELDWLYSGLAIDGGYRLGPTWWIHGDLSVVGRTGYGTTQNMTIIMPSADAYEARLGPEARGCRSDVLCGFAGVDIGYRTGRLQGLVVASRLGLDIGGRVRFRPGIELAIGGPVNTEEGPPIPNLSLGVTAAVAYQW